MRITWSVPVPGEGPESVRGDLVRARRLVAALRSLGHEVELVAASDGTATAAGVGLHRGALRRLLPRGIALPLRDLGRSVLARRHGRLVARRARETGAELIVETQVHGVDSGHRAAELAGLPLVLDDCSPSAEELALGSGLPALVRRGFARQLRKAALVVTVSEEARALLIAEGADPTRLRVVGNGVDLAEHERAREARARLRREWGLAAAGAPDPAVVAIFAGSFQPWHRAELLVAAAARLRDERLLLVFAGEGPHRRELEQTIVREGLTERCRLYGRVPPEHLAELLAAADVGVMPDSNEHGHPMKLVEYAAAGLALVAPDLPPVRALVRTERQGLLVRRADAAALAEALARLTAEPALRARLGESARREIAAGADWRALAAGLLP